MLENIGPLQQLIMGVGIVGILFILLVIYLTSSKDFKNIDRLTSAFNKRDNLVKDYNSKK